MGMSNGLLDFAGGFGGVLLISVGSKFPLLGVTCGVGTLDEDLLPSPNLTRDSIVLSRSPLSPFKTVEFLLSSGKPISRNVASLESIVSSVAVAV
jgi:hypothetical protein